MVAKVCLKVSPWVARQDGYGGATTYHPWRFPGKAPVKDACGITAGGTAPLGQLDPPPGFPTGEEGMSLPKLLEKTEWVAGSEVEVPWKNAEKLVGFVISFESNHHHGLESFRGGLGHCCKSWGRLPVPPLSRE